MSTAYIRKHIQVRKIKTKSKTTKQYAFCVRENGKNKRTSLKTSNIEEAISKTKELLENNNNTPTQEETEIVNITDGCPSISWQHTKY